MSHEANITDRLHEWSQGDQAALDDVVALIYSELRAVARSAMRGEQGEHTLQPTALVHEAYIRLKRLKNSSWENRTTFLRFAGRVMRQVLVEHARAAKSLKRGGARSRITLSLAGLSISPEPIDVLDVDAVLSQLESRDPEIVRLVELRYFAGLTEMETAEALEVSRSHVQRRWRVAKRLLVSMLEGEKGEE